MDDEQEIIVIRSIIGARMQAGQKPDGIARALWEDGYRLDPYPNGKSKPELIARIESLEAERDRTRFFLKQSHDDMIVATFPGLTMKDKREDHLKTCPKCQICAFMAETSTVKP